MKDYAEFADGLPDGVSRTVFKVPQRFRGGRKTVSTSRASDWSDKEDELHERPRSRKPRSVLFAQANAKIATTRGRAARNAERYSWKFVPVKEVVCDVDTLEYPFKLVRSKQLSDAQVHHIEELSQREHWQQWQHQWLQDDQQWFVPHQQRPATKATITRNCFMDCLDGDYIERTANTLREIAIDGSMTIRACVGRTLYHLNSLHPGRDYQLRDLAHIRHPYDLQSSWSNVCDDETPAIQALIEKLNRADSDVNLEPLKLKLTIRLCLKTPRVRPQYAKLTYFREDGKWVFAEVCGLSGVYSCHDLSLNDQTNFRIKITGEVYTPGKAWWGSVKDLVLFDESNGDPLTTEVSLLSSNKNLEIEFFTIKDLSAPVDFRGLSFHLAKKQGYTLLQALPPSDMVAKGKAGETFKFLVTRLLEILDELSYARR